MSDVSVDIIKNRSGEAPDLPSGANLSGVSTAATLQVTNLNPTHINASGVTTATTFSGSLKSTGTPTLGLGVTINSSGIVISGVATAGIVSATTLFGDGSNLTGVAMSIAPISYNPDVNDSIVSQGTGIGITFTELIKAGSGNVTLSIATNAGAAGTTVENFGVGSSVTINQNRITIDTTADLTEGETYHLSYPSGSFTNTSGDVSYVGTAYTFGAVKYAFELWAWGQNYYGQLGLNSRLTPSNSGYSSPVQLPGTTWNKVAGGWNHNIATKTDGTLWALGGENYVGELGQNNRINYSSPVQIPGSWSSVGTGYYLSRAIKTNGTLWSWGYNTYGSAGVNNEIRYSSPVQVPGTTWADTVPFFGRHTSAATKTDGTLWVWGQNTYAALGQNNKVNYSSPVQIPGTTWGTNLEHKVAGGGIEGSNAAWIKTDGTLWVWGWNGVGQLGLNSKDDSRSSPIQISGTTWKSVMSMGYACAATKTDGTLYAWGMNEYGQVGDNSRTQRSSPIQIPGTTWDICSSAGVNAIKVTKTDGTLWSWGSNDKGELAHNNQVKYSSPVQVPGNWSLNGISATGPNDPFTFAKRRV